MGMKCELAVLRRNRLHPKTHIFIDFVVAVHYNEKIWHDGAGEEYDALAV